MKLAILGAPGRTGKLLVQQALDAGHHVVAFARTPSKLGIEHEHLDIVQGDVQDAEQVATAIGGTEAVLSVLGPTSNEPAYEVSKGMANILAAMEKHGVRRLIQTVGAGIGDPSDGPGLLDRMITVLLKLASRYVYEDMVRVSDIIRASDLDWTLVRVPMLTNEPPAGDVKVGYLGKGVGSRISRADIAAFMVKQADSDTYLRQAPVISN
jgi:putative NADH-flavin reductase